MALFVDGPACTVDDLVAHDAGLLHAAQSEGIDVSMKIQLAMEEMTPDIEMWLTKPRSLRAAFTAPVLRLEQVAVTLALKRWQVLQSLALFYRDAYFSQLVDRYQAKWDAYTKLARGARESFVGSGMAIVHDPVRRAKAPVVGSVPASQAGGVRYAAVSSINSSGKEGAASEVVSISLADGQAMTVSAPDANGCWNVYAGTSLDALFLQNREPLNQGDAWTYVSGAAVQPVVTSNSGQLPDVLMPLVRTWMRG